jgi:hypothetical protein
MRSIVNRQTGWDLFGLAVLVIVMVYGVPGELARWRQHEPDRIGSLLLALCGVGAVWLVGSVVRRLVRR